MPKIPGLIAARGGSKLANYQACVLTGHSISKSEMTMSFCQAFLSKLLGGPYIHSMRKAISPYRLVGVALVTAWSGWCVYNWTLSDSLGLRTPRSRDQN